MGLQNKSSGRAYGDYIVGYGRKAMSLATLVKKIGARFLPTSLLYEMVAFVKRNSLIKTGENKERYICCEHCFKAHLLKKAQENNFENEIKSIFTCLNGEDGHYGYYIDRNNLIKI